MNNTFIYLYILKIYYYSYSTLEPSSNSDFAGGVELSFMSTSTDLKMAIQYTKKG